MAEGQDQSLGRMPRITAGNPPPHFGDYYLEGDEEYNERNMSSPTDYDRRSLGGASSRSSGSEAARLTAAHKKSVAEEKIRIAQDRLQRQRKMKEEEETLLQERLQRQRKIQEEEDERRRRNQEDENALLRELEELSLLRLKSQHEEDIANLELWGSDDEPPPSDGSITPLNEITSPYLPETTSFGLRHRPMATGLQSTPFTPSSVPIKDPPDPQVEKTVPIPNPKPLWTPSSPLMTRPPQHNTTSDQQGQTSNSDAGVATILSNVTSVLEKLMNRTDVPKPSVNQDKFLARQIFKYDLPQFHGNPLDWPMYKSAFDNSTRECDYNNTANLARLQRSVKGEAFKLVRGMMTSPDNVPVIMSKLQQVYGRPELVVETLILEVQAVSSAREDKMETLMEFEAAVTSLVTTINSMKATEYLNNPILVKELEKKLSPTLKLNWAIHAGSHSRTLAEFSTWVSSIVEAMQPLHTPKSSHEKKSDHDTKSRDWKYDKKKEGRTLVTSDPKPPSHPPKKEEPPQRRTVREPEGCPYCELEDHPVWKCPLFISDDVDLRKKWTHANNRCLNCFQPHHYVKDCPSKRRCRVTDCGRKHHTLLHGSEPFQPRQRATPEASTSTSSQVTTGQVNFSYRDRVQYKVVPVEILGPGNKSKKIFAMLDDCSAFTMLEKKIASELGLVGRPETVKVKVVGGDVRSMSSCTLHLKLRNLKTGEEFKLDEVNTFDHMDLNGGSFHKSDQNKYPHLREIDLATFTNVRPQMLIGLMHADLITPSKVVMSEEPNQPIAGLTKLGWVVYGRLPHFPSNVPVANSIHHLEKEEEPDLHQVVKQFFSTEDFGVKVCPNPQSRDEARAEEVVAKTLRRVGDRFEIGLLWKSNEIVLPPSKQAALNRLKSLERKMDRNPSFAEQYCKRMDHYIKSNYVEKVPSEEIASNSPRVWYLPHFAVFKSDKPDKPRIVFDAAATVDKVSLNSSLLTGPDELTPLHDVLSKFRERQVAISADIREMFNQVLIRKEDRDSQRFLWRGMSRNSPPEEYRMCVMTFGATCSPFSAQRVKNVNAVEWKDEYPRAVEAIVQRHYVDNYLDSVDTVDEAVQLQQQVFNISQKGGFHLCAWVSNSPKVLSAIPEELRSESQKLFSQKEQLSEEKILGLMWDPESDKFKFSMSFSKVDPEILRGEIPTKRQALALTMSLFDPLGFAALLTVRGKIILKKTWNHGIDWDERLPEPLHGEWRRWIKEVLAMKSFNIPRCYSPYFAHSSTLELHIFCDSSTLAFSAVGYWRFVDGNDYHTAFVEAKTRVTPVKPLSMPRCELQGAVMGSRLRKSIERAHTIKPTRVYFWVDTQYVLRCLKMDGTRFHQFVSGRIGEIQSDTDINDWRWISTKENVADEATRIDKPIDVSLKSRWLNGPPFLRLPESEWTPQPKILAELSPEEQTELKKEKFVGATTKEKVTNPLIDPSKYSNWMKLVRVTAWCQRVFSKSKPQREVLTPRDLDHAQNWWYKQIQGESYPHELKILRSGQEVKSGDMTRYSPTLDHDGIIRMQSRLRAAPIGLTVLDPIILPAKHPYTDLMIQHHHEKANHCGIDRVVNELKQKFTIPTLRAQVRRAWHQCQQCKNQRAKPIAPKMGILPTARLQAYQRPFTYTGMDYFGPIMVTVKRSREKRYGALFTCLVTRAVHVELASSLETDSCISAMRRFFSRRGQPREIWSDNGLNFVGAERELREELVKMNQTRMTNELSIMGISWNFIPPHAAHFGGSWERMVKAIKKSLYATLKERAPREETLLTLLAEAEYSVNCHPLAYVSEDPESPEVLTPNHFLLGPDYKIYPPAALTDRDLIPGPQWKFAQRLADHFWTRWVKEILPTLAQRSKWFINQKKLQVGDIVLLADENQPRSHWKKGRVIEVPHSKDGQVRWAMVKTDTSTYRRPTVKLVILDVGVPREILDPQTGDQPISPQQVLFLHDDATVKIVPKPPHSFGLREDLEVLKRSGQYQFLKTDYILYNRLIKFRTF